jgi:thioredoxin-like negative regulator of GroEL
MPDRKRVVIAGSSFAGLTAALELRRPRKPTTDDQIQVLTEASLDEAVARGITVVDLWAGWRGPCRAMAPQLERAAGLRPEHTFAKVEVDAQAGVIAADRPVAALDRIGSGPAHGAARVAA